MQYKEKAFNDMKNMHQSSAEKYFYCLTNRRLMRAAGFTLVELMTVLAIITILTMIAIPNLMAWMPNIHLRTSAREIYLSLQKARLEAAKDNSCTSISFTLTNNAAVPLELGGYNVFRDDGTGGGTPCNGTQDGTEQLLSKTVLSDGVSITGVSNLGGTRSFCFTPTSTVCGSRQGDIQLVNSTQNRWRKITLSAAGSVSQEVSHNGNAENPVWRN